MMADVRLRRLQRSYEADPGLNTYVPYLREVIRAEGHWPLYKSHIYLQHLADALIEEQRLGEVSVTRYGRKFEGPLGDYLLEVDHTGKDMYGDFSYLYIRLKDKYCRGIIKLDAKPTGIDWAVRIPRGTDTGDHWGDDDYFTTPPYSSAQDVIKYLFDQIIPRIEDIKAFRGKCEPMANWRRNPIPKFQCQICMEIFPADELDYIQDFDPTTLKLRRILVCMDCEESHKQEKYESNPYRRNSSDAQMRRLEREYSATGSPDVLDQIRVLQRRLQISTAAGPQAYKYGGHGVDHQLQHQRNTPLVFWSPVSWNSYVLVDHYSRPQVYGDFWEHPAYGDVDVISINGIGEIRWVVEPGRHHSPDDQSALAHFGFLAGDPCAACKGAGRILPGQFAMPYEAVACEHCEGTGLIPF